MKLYGRETTVSLHLGLFEDLYTYHFPPHTHTLYLPINGLRVSAESRKAHSSAMRCSFSLSCSTIANTSDVSSSQAMWGYLEGKENRVSTKQCQERAWISL